MAKILIVDDSETFRTQVEKLLIGAGHSVVDAEDGGKGLLAFAGTPGIQLIICDVNMPDVDGLTMCERLKAGGSTVPVFMLTTESSIEMKIRGKGAGVIAWVTKPFIPEKLLAAIEKVIGR